MKANYFIFHSGVNGTCDEVVTQLKPFVDNRFLIENKPIKGLDGSECVGATIQELDYIISELNSVYCLDFGHAICAARTQNIESLDYIKSLKEKFNPRVYHLTDGVYSSELHYGMGTFPLKELLQFVPSCYKVTNEAKRERNDCLIEIMEDYRNLKIIVKFLQLVL